jgi:hypothetical protein
LASEDEAANQLLDNSFVILFPPSFRATPDPRADQFFASKLLLALHCPYEIASTSRKTSFRAGSLLVTLKEGKATMLCGQFRRMRSDPILPTLFRDLDLKVNRTPYLRRLMGRMWRVVDALAAHRPDLDASIVRGWCASIDGVDFSPYDFAAPMLDLGASGVLPLAPIFLRQKPFILSRVLLAQIDEAPNSVVTRDVAPEALVESYDISSDAHKAAVHVFGQDFLNSE